MLNGSRREEKSKILKWRGIGRQYFETVLMLQQRMITSSDDEAMKNAFRKKERSFKVRNKPGRRIYWSILANADWKLHVAATDEGLCFVGAHHQPLDELTKWANRQYPSHRVIRNDEKLSPYIAELTEYLQGTLRQFTVPVVLRGTPFQQAVWQALRDIPYGHTLSYSDIAGQIRNPASARAVGNAIGANPLLIVVPCHRVIGKNGAPTGYRGGIDMKMKLLRLERDGMP
jgi:methylated-DNA-[protein]-cysteine S-methyltransferase